ncbi:hypothetical protein [Pseudoalteromonas sp. G4]|uniref:hypothetical protein n=1 Tax=Pseudoalteromonas sp. G4 TaxID=2992761 RepID=UPI00237DEC16|nr:hypothetical protein [Pseudoalteromonas sp. G4]MDE3273062.1 hypothetical protein [Pseudoalteromonas sp. G4]
MGKVRVVLLFVVLFFAFFSSESNANSAACILLKQQMSSYENTKTHPNYRRAQRDYERLCNKPEAVEVKPAQTVSKSEPTLTEEEKRLAQEQFEALEQKQNSEQLRLAQEQFEALEQKQNSEQQLVEETKANLEQTQTIEPNTKPAEEVSTPVVAPKKQPQPKPVPVTWQNEVPVEQGSLLEAMMLPIIMLVVVLIAIFIYVKFVRSRMDEIKEKAQEMSKEIVAAGVKAAEKKKAKPAKGALDPDLYFRRQRIEIVLPNGQEVMLDSVVASQYGVFVVLGQKQRGAIIGSATLPEWKEQVGDDLVAFDSPLNVVNQCCHAVEQIIELNTELEPIVAFNDMAVFKSQFPIAVMHKKKVNEYILGFKELKYSDEQVDEWLLKIDAYVAARAEQKSLAEEQQRQQNLNRHNGELAQTPLQGNPSPAELAEQEIAEKEQETQYPEPGSYENSVAEIAADHQDLHRVEELEKPAVDHIAELDAILNKAKEFTEKLDSISSESSASENDTSPNEIPESIESLDSTNRTAEFNELSESQNTDSAQFDDTTTNLPEESVSPSFVDESVAKNEPETTPDSFAHPLSTEQESILGVSDSEGDLSFETANVESTTDIEPSSALTRDDVENVNELDTYSPETEEPLDVMKVNDESDSSGSAVSEFENRDSLEENHQLDNEIISDKGPSHFAQDDDTPENMVPHSEFKRRAAKRAVDEGMFDYLNHYDGKAAPAVDEDDSERSLEEELAQSLAAGKGFLSGLDDAGKLEESEVSEESSETTEQSDIASELEEHLENEIDLTSFTQDESLSSFDTIPSDSESLDNDTDNSNLGGWRAIKAQMNEVEEPPTFGNEQIEDAPKSSWRALKEQVASEEPELQEDDSDKNEEATKSSLFSNLELDPDWAPKPPPEKVFKVKPEDDPDNN